MKRDKFLHTITGSLAVACVSCLAAACSKNEMVIAPASSSPATPTNPTTNVFTVNLGTEIKTINEYVAKNSIIVIRQASTNLASSFLAVSSVCPHAGSTVEFNSSKSTFLCAAHGSTFASDGSLTQGPAARGLTKLTVEISGTTLTVK